MNPFRTSPRALLATLFLGAALGLMASAVQAREKVSIVRDNVNMRAGPGTRTEALWALTRGYPLEVVGQRGSWIKVSDFEQDQGWVLRSLTQRTPHHIVKAKVANLRSAPNTQSRVLGKAHYGDVMRTLERRNGWVKVRHDNGRTGWVAQRLVWGW